MKLAKIALVLAMAAVPARAGTPAPLPGYPSCDYAQWQVVGQWDGANRGTWSPDGSQFVMGSEIIDVATGQVVGQIPFQSTVYRPSWSPDGKTIVFDSPEGNPSGVVQTQGAEGPQAEGDGNDLWAYDLPTGKLSRLTQDLDGSNNFARFSHHGSRLAWIRSGLQGQTRFIPMVGDLVRESDGTARIDDEEPLIADSSDAAYGAFNRIGEFTADDLGVLLISTRSNSGNGDVWRIDLETGEWTNLTDAPSWEEHPRASPNGQKISFMSTRDYPVQSVNILLEISRLTNSPSSFDNLLIFPAAVVATRFAFSGEEYLANPDGTEPTSLTFNTPYGIEGGWFSRGAEFSPTGTRLAIAQRPVDRITVLPGVVVSVNGQPGGRVPRTLVIEFACANP